MVATGDVRSFPGRVRVTSMGTETWEGWTIVARYPAALMQSGSGHYAFLVRGTIGEVFEVAGPPVASHIDVTIAMSAPGGGGIDRIGTSYRTLLPGRFSSPPFEEGLPFGFIAMSDTTLRFPGLQVDPDIGATWPADRDLLVIARTWRNGDPPSTQVDFTVSDLWVMHWDLQRVPLSHLALSEYAPAAPVPFSESRTLLHSETLPATTGTWLYFNWLRYQPFSTNAARFEVTMQEAGGPEVTMIGGHRLGHGLRGQITQNAFSALAFRPVVRNPGVALTLRLYGSAGIPSVSAVHFLSRWRVLGVRLEDGVSCSYPAILTEDREPLLAQAPGNPAVWLWERTRADRIANLVAIFQASVAWPNPQTSTFDAVLTDDQRTAYRVPTLYPALNGAVGEGGHSLVVARRLRANYDFRWRLHMWHRPSSSLAPADCVDIAAAEWTFETTPSNQPTLGPQPPAPLQLVPSREALAPNYLPIPPHDIYDANGWSEEPVDNQRRFEADSGVMRTWPVFIGVKSVWSFTRSGLTRTQLVALLAFFKTNTNFRVRLPRRKVDTACKVIDRPAFDDGGGVYTMSLRAVELIHIGGLP